VGLTTQARLQPPVGITPPPLDATPQARLNPPVGATARAAGRLSIFDRMLVWLHSRLSVPNG